MNRKLFSLLIATSFVISLRAFAQVELKTGTIYGKVVDEQEAPLPGVLIKLKSDVATSLSATSGSSGSFRFANLSPGIYSALFSQQGFTQVKQENIRVYTGSQVQLRIVLKPSMTEELTVLGETPLLDSRKTGNFEVYDREYLNRVPTAHDPWSVIDQTPGIDTNRYQVTQQGVQASFTARGAESGGTFVYDGINISDPVAIGATASYYDFEALEEIQINTTGGISINMVTKRPGNRWAANASYYYFGENLQSSNTPEELVAIGLEDQSNRLDQITDYGFDIGGPLIKDKLFVWGAYRKYNVDVFTITNEPDSTELENFNFKANFNWTSGHESQFNYFLGNKAKFGRGFDPANQSPETLWDQDKSDTLLPGLWGGQHTWTPSDHTIVTARYAYVGLGFQLVPRGRKDVPMVLLSAIPHWEDTSFFVDPIDRPAHDVSVDVNYFKESWTGGDHEFKFGFNYRTVDSHTFSSYGNGVLLVDFYQTIPQGPLTSGLAIAQHHLDGRGETNNVNFLISDTFRTDRLTLTFGLNFNRSTGKNLPATISAVPGFEPFVGAVEYPGGDPGIVFNTFSPQIGATYDLTGDGKTLIRGNFGRYYDAFTPILSIYSNPTSVYNGAFFGYTNRNNDRTISPDEITTDPFFYGGLSAGGFDLDAFLAKRLYDEDLHPGWVNDIIVGIERQLISDLSLSLTYTHRDYRDRITQFPFGVSADDYVPGGTFTASTPLGDFSVPYFVLGYTHDGTRILTNLDGYNQSYDGVDFVVRKRMSHNFMLNGSLTLQRQRANYEGGNSLGQNARAVVSGQRAAFFPFDPSTAPFLDGQPYTDFNNLYSEWQFKLNGVYLFPRDISVGGSLKYRQGYPYVLAGTISDSSLSAFTGTDQHLILVEPFGSRRYDNIFILDLQVEKVFHMGEYGQLALSANVFNVTNENAIIDRNNSMISSSFNRIEEHLAPRVLRLGVRYGF